MTHMVHDPVRREPLDSFTSPVRTLVSVRHGRTDATAEVKANWSRIEVRVVDPPFLSGITWTRDRSGFSAALAALHDPSQRFTYNGHLTARGLRIAQRMALKALHDRNRVKHDAQSIAARCLLVQRHLNWIDREMRRLADRAPRRALKSAFKKQHLSQQQYQTLRRRLRDSEDRRCIELMKSRRHMLGNVAGHLHGSSISFNHALVHLSNPDVLDRLDEGSREQIQAIAQARPVMR